MEDCNKKLFDSIGEDVRISKSAEITRPHLVKLGNHIAIDMGVYMSVSAELGDYIHIAPHVCIIGGAEAKLIMESFTGIAAGSKIICAGDDYKTGILCPLVSTKYRRIINKPIVFKKFSCVGVNSIVMPGVVLAEGSVLGAGSLLTRDTEPWTIYVGSPAKAIGKREFDLCMLGAKELGY